MKLILASGSPYRKELLARLRIPFSVIAPDIIYEELEIQRTREITQRPPAVASPLGTN